MYKIEIKELEINESNLSQAFPVVSQLRPHLSLEEYIKLSNLMKPQGYQIFCLYKNEKITAYAGVALQTNLYYGKHIWVYELVTDKSERSKGFGKMLLSYIEAYAKECSAQCVALSSGLEKLGAHSFYENIMDYDKVSYVFKKLIPSGI